MNYLGLDWGKSKVGLATGSDAVSLALPFKTIIYKSDQDLLTQLQQIINEEMIDLVVVGRPLSLSGDLAMSDQFVSFVEAVKGMGVVVELMDERMSTKEAQKLMLESGSKDDDVVAATIILQSYLDKQNNSSGNNQ